MSTTSSHAPAHAPHPAYYTPGYLVPKIIYLIFGLCVLALGLGYLWEPLGRCLYGNIADASVVRIVKTQPGAPAVNFTFRQEFPKERDWGIVYQHYVNVLQQGKTLQLHLGVDTHQQPDYNINDHLRVCYYPGNSVGFDVWNLRSWAIGMFISLIGLIFMMNGVFLVWAARRPIKLDHEAEDFTKELDEGHPPPPPMTDTLDKE